MPRAHEAAGLSPSIRTIYPSESPSGLRHRSAKPSSRVRIPLRSTFCSNTSSTMIAAFYQSIVSPLIAGGEIFRIRLSSGTERICDVLVRRVDDGLAVWVARNKRLRSVCGRRMGCGRSNGCMGSQTIGSVSTGSSQGGACGAIAPRLGDMERCTNCPILARISRSYWASRDRRLKLIHRFR